MTIDAPPPSPAESPRAREVLETCLYARDLEAAERFYTEVMGLERFAAVAGRHVFFRCGARVFLVFDPDETRRAGGALPPHGAEGAGHVCFAVRDEEIPAWRAHLREHGVEVEGEVQWPSGARSLYFRDPAGNCLEVASPRLWGIEQDDVLPAEG